MSLFVNIYVQALDNNLLGVFPENILALPRLKHLWLRSVYCTAPLHAWHVHCFDSTWLYLTRLTVHVALVISDIWCTYILFSIALYVVRITFRRSLRSCQPSRRCRRCLWVAIISLLFPPSSLLPLPCLRRRQMRVTRWKRQTRISPRLFSNSKSIVLFWFILFDEFIIYLYNL